MLRMLRHSPCNGYGVLGRMLAVSVGGDHAAEIRIVQKEVVEPGFQRAALSQIHRVFDHRAARNSRNLLKNTVAACMAAIINY